MHGRDRAEGQGCSGIYVWCQEQECMNKAGEVGI